MTGLPDYQKGTDPGGGTPVVGSRVRRPWWAAWPRRGSMGNRQESWPANYTYYFTVLSYVRYGIYNTRTALCQKNTVDTDERYSLALRAYVLL